MNRLRSSIAALCIIATVAVMAIATDTSGPGAIPETWRGEFFTHSWDSSRELFVVAFWCTAESLRLYFGNDDNAETINLIMQAVTNKWPGRQVLQVAAIPETVGKFYWWPWSLVLVQGHVQYDVKPADLLPLTDAFAGGRLYGTGIGFLAIPLEIDTTKTFQLWYYGDSMTLGPFLR
jgi:hypothetical protein